MMIDSFKKPHKYVVFLFRHTALYFLRNSLLYHDRISYQFLAAIRAIYDIRSTILWTDFFKYETFPLQMIKYPGRCRFILTCSFCNFFLNQPF
ncbi:hypothetical protein D3C74_381800 [compost metagenome]